MSRWLLLVLSVIWGGCLIGDDVPTERLSGADVATCQIDPAFALSWHCNEDAERAQAVLVDRDECDVDPCGFTDVETESWAFGENLQLNETRLYYTDGRRKLGTDDLRTGWRFCRCEASQANNWVDRQNCLQFDPVTETGGCEVATPAAMVEFYDADPAHWWPMTLTNSIGGGAIGSTIDLTYDGPGQRVGGVEGNYTYYPDLKRTIGVDWNIAADAGEWLPGELPPEYSLPGVLWTHTPGPTGEADFPLAERERASNYVSGGFGRTSGDPSPDTDPDIGIGPAPLPWRSLCPDCPWTFPRPFLLIPDCLGLPGCTDPAELRFGPMARDATGVFVGGAGNGLGQVAGTWVSAAEPDVYQGTTGVRYAAVATNGTSVSSILTLSSSGLSRTTPSNGGSPPSSRSLFGAVVSVTKNRIWVMGGINGSGGLLQDLRAYNIGTQTWSQVTIPGSYKPSRVLAAAYSPGEDRLLVLDQVTAGGSIRLIRLDPNGSASSQLVGTWSRTASTTTFALTSEPGNRAYMVACGGASTHAVLRFRRSGTGVVLWKTGTGSGPLTSQSAQASVEGVSLLVDVAGAPWARGFANADLSSGGSVGLCF